MRVFWDEARWVLSERARGDVAYGAARRAVPHGRAPGELEVYGIPVYSVHAMDEILNPRVNAALCELPNGQDSLVTHEVHRK